MGQIKVTTDSEQMDENIDKLCKIMGVKRSKLANIALHEYINMHMDKIKK